MQKRFLGIKAMGIKSAIVIAWLIKEMLYARKKYLFFTK